MVYTLLINVYQGSLAATSHEQFNHAPQTMNLAQFEAIATLISSREPAKSASRQVLVDGIANIEAARAFNLSPQSVSNTVGRFRIAEALILGAYDESKESAGNTRSNVYNLEERARHSVSPVREVRMSKFVQIPSAGNPAYFEILNLDHVATVSLSPRNSMSPKDPEVVLSLYGAEKYSITTLYFENSDAARYWVLQHLGIKLSDNGAVP